jgi:DNA-binding transcriptional ArsR family regulator
MSVPVLTAADIFSERPESKTSNAPGKSKALTDDGEGVDWSDLEPRKQKSVEIGHFARFPNKLFGSGLANRLGPSATLFYLALCECANREKERVNTCSVTDRQLAWESGLSPRTLRNLRTKLMEHGLVTFQREPGQKYTYTLLPQQLEWFKLKERPPRQKRKPRGNSAQLAKTQA